MTENGSRRSGSRWRIAAWSFAALILLVPMIAMQFSDEVGWTLFDFVFAGVLILSVGLPLELVVRKTSDTAYRWAIGLALAAAFLLVWINGAVGIIGSEDNPANLLYGGVLAIAIIGAFIARFHPEGMARAMFAAALAQAAIAVGAAVAGLGSPWSGPFEIVVLNGFFVALWAGSAVLFQRVAEDRAAAEAEPEG